MYNHCEVCRIPQNIAGVSLGLKEKNPSLLEETKCGARLDIGWLSCSSYISWSWRDFVFLFFGPFCFTLFVAKLRVLWSLGPLFMPPACRHGSRRFYQLLPSLPCYTRVEPNAWELTMAMTLELEIFCYYVTTVMSGVTTL